MTTMTTTTMTTTTMQSSKTTAEQATTAETTSLSSSSPYEWYEDPRPSSTEDDEKLGWAAFFEEMDELEDALYETNEALAEAVAREDYGAAGVLKARYKELEGQDTTLGIEGAFASAVSEERYADAARLRDEGGVRMLGWWVGREDDGDMAGHLVEVRRGVGRYVGRAFMGGGEVGDGGEIFEVFYREGVSGRYESCATVLDGRMIFLGDDEEEFGEEVEFDGNENNEEDEDDDGIRTVEDLLNMGEEKARVVVGVDEGMTLDDTDPNLTSMATMITNNRQEAEIEWLDKDRFVLRMDVEGGLGTSDEMQEVERLVTGVMRGKVLSESSLEEEEREEREDRDEEQQQGIEIHYRRLREEEKGELYLGSFGPHGQEVVHIYTTTVDGRKIIEGRYVLGCDAQQLELDGVDGSLSSSLSRSLFYYSITTKSKILQEDNGGCQRAGWGGVVQGASGQGERVSG